MTEQAQMYVGRWHGPEGCRIALIKRGRQLLHVCVLEHPVTVIKVPLREERHVTALNYPLGKAARKFRHFARSGNATQAALALIKEALASVTSTG